MKKVLLSIFLLCSTALRAQTVSQGAPADATNADAWPIKVIYGNVQIDPRDVSDRAGRILGQVVFVVPQHVIVDSGTINAVQSGTWTVTGAGGTFPVTGTFWPTTAGAPSSTRLSDGASFYDSRSIRALTFVGDKVDVTGSTVGPVVGTASGTFTTNGDQLVINTSGGVATVGFTLTGAAWSTILKFQGSHNGSTWFDLTAVGTNFTPVVTVTAVSSNGQNGPYLVNATGFSSIRATATSAMTGTLNLTAFYATHDSGGPQYTYMVGGLGASSSQPSFSAVTDANNFNTARVFTADPVGGDRGLVVRNIPSGTQNDNITQFGGTNVSTGTGAGGAGIPRVTVSNDSTVTANQGTNNATPWNENVAQWIGSTAPSVGSKTMTNSIPVVPSSDYVGGAAMEGNVTFSSGAACPAASATAVTSSAGCIVVPLFGNHAAEAEVQAGTLAATWIPQHSFDGGITWVNSTYLLASQQGSGGVAITNPNARQSIQWILETAPSHVRLSLTAFTSGTAVVYARATKVMSPYTIGALCAGLTGGTIPFWSCMQGGIVRTAVPTAGTALTGQISPVDPYGIPFVRLDHLNRFTCIQVTSTATILTLIPTCTAPGASLSRYVTDVTYSSNVNAIGADAFPTLKYGTGGACGTGTVIFWGRLTAVANFSDHETFVTPFKIPANNEICWMTTSVGSKFVIVNGYIAP